MELGVGRTPNNLFPTWSPAPENKSISFTLPLGLYLGISECVSKDHYLHTGRSLLSTHWEAKNSPAPLWPCNRRRDSWFQ